jgi:hypothetical protein
MTEHAPEPMLVLNPKTENTVNIAPIIYLVNEEFGGDFIRVSKAIDKVIQSLVCHNTEAMQNNPISFCGRCFDLFKLRDAFSAINEIKAERRLI